MSDKSVIWWERYWVTNTMVVMPVAVCVLPIPLAVPIAIIGTVIDQPEEWPLIPVFFGWVLFGLRMMWLSDKNKEQKQ